MVDFGPVINARLLCIAKDARIPTTTVDERIVTIFLRSVILTYTASRSCQWSQLSFGDRKYSAEKECSRCHVKFEYYTSCISSDYCCVLASVDTVWFETRKPPRNIICEMEIEDEQRIRRGFCFEPSLGLRLILRARGRFQIHSLVENFQSYWLLRIKDKVKISSPQECVTDQG